jgi:hypothetical protein
VLFAPQLEPPSQGRLKGPLIPPPPAYGPAQCGAEFLRCTRVNVLVLLSLQVGVDGVLLNWTPCSPSEDPEKIVSESPVVKYTYCLRVAGGPQVTPCAAVGTNLQVVVLGLNLAQAASRGRLVASVMCTNKANLNVRWCFKLCRVVHGLSLCTRASETHEHSASLMSSIAVGSFLNIQ